jgi:hypothetical protein
VNILSHWTAGTLGGAAFFLAVLEETETAAALPVDFLCRDTTGSTLAAAMLCVGAEPDRAANSMKAAAATIMKTTLRTALLSVLFIMVDFR